MSTDEPMSVSSGELEYYDRIGSGGRVHALNKPYSDDDVGPLLAQAGAIISLLPSPPARVLECGCGPGWLSKLLAKCGYEVTGTDIAPAAIELAKSDPIYADGLRPTFRVAAAESLPFHSEFDVVLYFDSLHHVGDERAAIQAAFEALRPGGILVTSEPGAGHHECSQATISEYGVTERDMPAHHIRDTARAAGFIDVQLLARADDFINITSGPGGGSFRRRLSATQFGPSLRVLRRLNLGPRDNGIVLAHKPS